jgi:hypothetical protein
MQLAVANIKVIIYEEATGKLKDIYYGLVGPICLRRRKSRRRI